VKLFSTNAASLLLEKDRRTVTKAMQGVAPDAKVNGQARWKLRKFVDALAAHERPAGGSGNSTAGANPPEYERFDRAFDAMTKLEPVEKRRSAALKLVPLLTEMISALRARGRDLGEAPEMTALRGDRVYQLALIGFQGPCSWSHEQVWEHLNIDTN
jgi:hypothetical protein